MITFVRPGKRAKPYSSGGASRIGPRTKIGAAVPATCARAALRVQDVPAHSTSSSAWVCCIEQQREGVNTDWPPWPSDETAPPASVPSKGSGQRTGKVRLHPTLRSGWTQQRWAWAATDFRKLANCGARVGVDVGDVGGRAPKRILQDRMFKSVHSRTTTPSWSARRW